MIDKKSKALFLIFIIILFLTIAATYYKNMILRDFVIVHDTEELSTEE